MGVFLSTTTFHRFFRCGAIAFVFTLLVAGCARNEITTYPSLSNQGILPLSTSDQTLGANLFLARELEASSYLFQFFQSKGSPTAIEIVESKTRPVIMYMFYPRNTEVYVAQMQKAGFNREWIIRGPYSIAREDFRELKKMQTSFQGEPVFQIYGKPYRFRFQKNRVARSVEPEVPMIQPKKKPVQKAKPAPKKVKKPLKPVVPKADVFDPAMLNALNSDQMAIAMSKGFAERNDSGDIIHTVKGGTETLEQISKWYAGSADMAKVIAGVNSLEKGADLKPGQRITVPLKIVKEFKAMPYR